MRTVRPEDLDHVAASLTGVDGEDGFDGLLWYGEDEGCIAMYNADSVRRVVNVSVVGMAVRLRLGNPENILFTDDTLQMTLGPGEAAVLQKLDGFPFGLYKGNVYLDGIYDGEMTVRGTNGKPCYVAGFTAQGGTEELVRLDVAEENTAISFSGQNISKIKLMGWEALQPYTEAKSLERTYSKEQN